MYELLRCLKISGPGPEQQTEPFQLRRLCLVPDVTRLDISALHAVRSELHIAVVQPIKHFRSVGIDARLRTCFSGVLPAAERQISCEREPCEVYWR
jgi:hypothetical protein